MDAPQTLLQARRTPGRDGGARALLPPRGRASEAADPAQGLLLGRYRLFEQLGAGGFGVVWRAHDELLLREVAVKRVPRTGGGDPDRSSREALAAARLSHPAIVALYEACATDDAFYLISELVDGETLARLIAARALRDEAVFSIGDALAGALAHAHSRGVVHRDVKPSNVIVPRAATRGGAHGVGEAGAARTDADPAAKLTDFGGAWMSDAAALTRTGDVLGTLAYMAPEQANGGEVAEPADLYSLALVLYEALCGRNPVRGTTPAETARRIGERVPSLARARGDLPREVTDALDRALTARPRSRGTLAELRAPLVRARERAQVHELTPAQEPAEHRDAVTVRRPRARGARPPSGGAIAASTAAALGVHRSDPRGEVDAATPAVTPDQPAQPRVRGSRSGLPRAVWLAAAGAAVVWEAISGRPGLALLLLAASAPLMLLGRRGGGAWLLGTLAPALGVAGLAGAFPAIAGQVHAWRTRAALGALGYWWLTLAEPLSSQRLWLRPARALPPRSTWESSLSGAVHVLAPAFSAGVLLGAAAWAAGALALPLLVRGRSALADALGAALWSCALVIAARALDGPLPAGAAHASPRGAIVGALFGAALALGARALRGPV